MQQAHKSPSHKQRCFRLLLPWFIAFVGNSIPDASRILNAYI
jgi:hypothetical protein